MYKKGFTLSEVLITVAIIGVVAAITLPILNNNTRYSEYRSALKKSISGLNQALFLSYALEGTSGSNYSTASDLVTNVFKKRMSVLDNGNKFTNEEVCSPIGDGENVFTTADGIKFCVTNWKITENDIDETNESICNSKSLVPCYEDSTLPNLWIDVNGNRKPNKATGEGEKFGDIFSAYIFDKRFVPMDIATLNMMSDEFKFSAGNGNNSPEQPKEEKPEEEEPEEECDPKAHCTPIKIGNQTTEMCNTSCPYKRQCKDDPDPNPFLGFLPPGMNCL